MTRPLDEASAWRALLELDPGSSGRAGPLRVEPDGTWTCSTEVTERAATLLDLFAPLRVRDRLVVGQLGQSLDGRIATEGGHSHYVTGPEDIRRLHRLRALVQAVVVGAGTVASDDPRLTVRHVEGDAPVRVVLDPRGRLDPGRTVFTDGEAPTLWMRADGEASGDVPREAAGEEPGHALDEAGGGTVDEAGGEGLGEAPDVEIVTLPTTSDGSFAPRDILSMLEGRGLRRVLVEGGGVTVSRFLAAGALDRLHLSVAPLLIGSGRPSITLPPIETLDAALRPPVRRFRLGNDVLFDLSLDRPGA